MDAQEFAAQVDDLERKLERLRALFEQYFMGIEKIEPSVLRHEVEKRFRALRKERCHNTGVRFRFQTLIQRHTILMAHWQRVCRAIEEGTYEPHVQRARRLLEGGGPAVPGAAPGPARRSRELVLEVDVVDPPPAGGVAPAADGPSAPPGEVARVRNLADLRALLLGDDAPGAGDAPTAAASPPSPPAAVPAASAPSAPPASPPAGPSPPPGRPRAAAAVVARPPVAAPPGGAPGPDQARAIRLAFADAARKAASPVAVPSDEAIRRSLAKEAERLGRKHPGKRVDFRVELKDGKPVIRSFVVASPKG